MVEASSFTGEVLGVAKRFFFAVMALGSELL